MGILLDIANQALTEPMRAVTTAHAESSVTPEQRSELRRLVDLTASHYGFTDEQRREALEIALADPAPALNCFQGLAAKIAPTERVYDDRRLCTDCAELSTLGKCRAAQRGKIEGAGRDYSPVRDLPCRCAHFKPKAH